MSKKLGHLFACNSLMLPEHPHHLALHRASSERREKYRRPVLDEQEQELFQQALQRSLAEGTPLTLTVLSDSGCRQVTGTVAKLEPWAGRLRLRTAAGPVTVHITDIIQVRDGS